MKSYSRKRFQLVYLGIIIMLMGAYTGLLYCLPDSKAPLLVKKTAYFKGQRIQFYVSEEPSSVFHKKYYLLETEN